MPRDILDKPITKLRAKGDPPLALYWDHLEERMWPFSRIRYELRGVRAKVEPVGKSLTLRNQAMLTITGPGVNITRKAKGSMAVRALHDFASAVNASASVHGGKRGRR